MMITVTCWILHNYQRRTKKNINKFYPYLPLLNRVYQAFTLGLVIWLNKEYVITSEEPSHTLPNLPLELNEVEHGYGRADLMLIPHDKTKKGIIFEFKKADKRAKQTLEQAAAEAKQQIIDKHYRKKMDAHGVLDVICLAVAFKGKDVLVVEVK